MKWLWKSGRKLARLRGSMEEITRRALKLGEDREGWCNRLVVQQLIAWNSMKGKSKGVENTEAENK